MLCSEALKLAELHAGLLRASTSLSLSGQVDLLLNLLAIPSQVRVRVRV